MFWKIFSTFLDLQKLWRLDRDLSYFPCTQFSLFRSYVSMIHLPQLVKPKCMCAQSCLTLSDLVDYHFLLQGNLPNLGIQPTSLASTTLAGRFFTTEPLGKPVNQYWYNMINWKPILYYDFLCFCLMIIFHPRTHLVNVPPLASLNYERFSDYLVLVTILIVLKIMVSFCRVLHFDFTFFFFPDHFVLQISSVSQSCLSLCDPMEYSMPGLLVHPKSWGLLKLMSIELVMSFNHQLCCYFIHLFSIFEKQHEVNYHYCIMSRVYITNMNSVFQDSPCGPVAKNPPPNAGDMVQSLFGELTSHLCAAT